MNLLTVPRYLFGNARAIRTVAESSAALPLGVALVLLTAVARNYDQIFITETPLWLFGPLLFSFFSGAWLFFILYHRCVKRFLDIDPLPPASGQWRSFMGLFWMTAPIAWLYAIPVERFLDPVGAAKANITLLAIVSLWRVLLMSRVVAVVNAVRFLRALGWVLVGASLEIIVVVFLGGFFGGSFAKRVMAGMSGMRNAPDESLLLSALGFAWNGAWMVLVITLVLLAIFQFRGTTLPFPKMNRDRAPWGGLCVLAIVWALIAWPAQKEQQRFRQHAHLVLDGKYSDGLAYASRFDQSAFPASRRLEPNPFEHRVWEDLPPTIALLTTNTPAWVRRTYLSHLANTFEHHWAGYRSLTNVAMMYAAIERLSEGRDWLCTNEAALTRQGVQARRANDSAEAQERNAFTNILFSLRAMGMAETNVTKLAEK